MERKRLNTWERKNIKVAVWTSGRARYVDDKK
jgi:hypothetical protein